VDSHGIEFPGYSVLSALSLRPEMKKIIDVISTEATRKWITITNKGEDDKTQEISQLESELERLNVRHHFRHLSQLDSTFGRGHLWINLENDENELKIPIGNGPDNWTKKFQKGSLKELKGSLKELKVIEPLWVNAQWYGSRSPLEKNFYRPSSWWVMGTEVAESRLLRFVSREVPDLFKPAYYFGGLPLILMALSYVDNYV
jgi:uncharacterized protein